MATTSMLTGNALTVKRWALKGWTNLGATTVYGYAASKGIIHFADDFIGRNARGDNLTYDYTNKLTGIPVGEGGTLDGNEEALNLGNYQIAMNTTRIGVLNPNDDTIEQQRTNVNFARQASTLVPARHGELVDTSFFYQAAGANPTSFTLNGTTWSGTNKLFVQGHNTPVAPSSNRIIRAAAAATDEALTSSDKMSLDLVDYALEKMRLSNQPIAMIGGYYDLFVSPEQAVDLRQDSTGKIQWYNINLAQITGGLSNTLETNVQRDGMIALGTYQNVRIWEAQRVAYGQNSSTSAVITTVRRAVLLGKDALTFASPFASKLTDSDAPLRFFNQLKDYDYYKGIEGRMIYGLKKTVPSNGEDVGTFVISTYAASHS
jgi:hypothetical protein